MKKFDNYIFMAICELTMEFYKNTNYQTYSGYCIGFKMALRDGKLSSKQKDHVIQIGDYLEKVYGLNPKEFGYYVSEYFETDKHLIFEQPVRLTKEFFPFVGC